LIVTVEPAKRCVPVVEIQLNGYLFLMPERSKMIKRLDQVPRHVPTMLTIIGNQVPQRVVAALELGW
jgi:hypothetical protein